MTSTDRRRPYSSSPNEAQALTRKPDAPALLAVTRAMSVAIEALPDVDGGNEPARKVRALADAMTQRPNETDALARASLEATLEAVRHAETNVPTESRDHAVEAARQAIDKIRPGERATVDLAYREVARAMLVVSGGRGGAAVGSELSQLVARIAVEEPDDARRTGAEVIAALGDTMQRLAVKPEHAGHIAGELRKRADRLAHAQPLDYAEQLKGALSLAVGALNRAAVPPAVRHLLDEAQVAVEGQCGPIVPVELQRPVVQDALRLVTDAIRSVSVDGEFRQASAHGIVEQHEAGARSPARWSCGSPRAFLRCVAGPSRRPWGRAPAA